MRACRKENSTGRANFDVGTINTIPLKNFNSKFTLKMSRLHPNFNLKITKIFKKFRP